MMQTAGAFSVALAGSKEAGAGPRALQRLGGPDWVVSTVSAEAGGGTGAGSVILGQDPGIAVSVLALAEIGQAVGRTPLGLAAASPLSFDGSSGQLAIRTVGGEHTVREALTADGFVDVTLDGQEHSSNPRSASFDGAIAGASGATLAGIRFDGSGQDTLTLGSQHLANGFTLQAAGATVLTENVAAAGPLMIQAPNITVNGTLQGSSVSLAASAWVNVNAAGRIGSGTAVSGSDIGIAADVFVNSGQLHADGPSGGQIDIQANKILNAGPITAEATGPSMNGGQVHIAFTDSYVATTAAVISAGSATGRSGSLTVNGGSTGRLYSSGRHMATGSVGGSIDLLGREVVLSGATVDASGERGGGSVRIGGDVQARDPSFANTQTVTITPASTIRADAVRSGAGGRVSIWADQSTSFAGSVSARGGPAGGSGGLIEVSGKGDLTYAASADASAPSGKSGTLLLDPKNIIISDTLTGIFPQFDLIDPHPTAGDSFGSIVSVVGNGNVVVANPPDDFGGPGAGAVYLFDGSSGALVSSLIGSHANDAVGSAIYSYSPIVRLTNGNYLVVSPGWNSNRGAVTWASGRTGISGVVSDGNSLVGSNPGNEYTGDMVGVFGYVFPLSNGNYVVGSRNGGDGAVTWGNGNIGISGIVTEANSLIGGGSIVLLTNGNYLVVNPGWNGGRGAVTWGDGTTGIRGMVSAGNSLVGGNPGDYLGLSVTSAHYSAYSVFALSNGNYIVVSNAWNGYRGAVTWGDGNTGISGIVSEVNSLVGSTPGDGDPRSANSGDLVGFGITFLPNGNYVVKSPDWNEQRGAVTWGNGRASVSGTVSAANSLVGTDPGDLSFSTSVTPLSDSNYLVLSPNWNNQRGAATWANGSTGISGPISAVNSLVGSNPGDQVSSGYPYLTSLRNGNYVIESPLWNSARGAATWGDASSGVRGVVSEANSLIGSNPGDSVGLSGTPLSNGNFLVQSDMWNGGRGALTWGNGSTGITGTLSAANSLIGGSAGDQVRFLGHSLDQRQLRRR
ncbi:MAG TPA: hypothetical protein VKU02_08860 [Gemmataceae bacterium]|nr:hypothetical protein [Gemmataceae bacterium]